MTTLDINNWRSEFDRLLKEEGLDDPREFLRPLDEFDEVPLYSRICRIEFLNALPVEQKSALLLAFSLEYLDRVVHIATQELPLESLREFFVMVTIMNWCGHDRGEAILPCFWTTTLASKELRKMALRGAISTEAQRTTSWLRDLGLIERFSVFDYAVAPADRALMRVHVGHRRLPRTEMPGIVQLAS